MKLYLSSYKLGNYPERLVKLVGNNKKTAVVMNAVDFGDKDRRAQSLQEQITQLDNLGFEAEELDLRKYFGKKEELEQYLSDVGLVWIRGGNAFGLQRAFEQSGFGELIKRLLEKDKIVYAGFSAAICLITPTLRGLDIVDDPNAVPEGYKEDFSWDGLGLIDYNVAMHYKSDHPESEAIDKEVEYYKKNNVPYKTLRDGEVIVIDGEKEEILRL